ncbi:MAG: hypothetical protein JST68_23875 [Bacteroidetes bacterium]|nr:hypothetical protein [Bacteroidota bacterium]
MKNKLFIVLGLAIAFMSVSCKKDYLSGGTLSVANTPLNNMDYLAANQYKQFDTLVQVINKLGMANEVNSAKTFFAPTDFSIKLYMDAKALAKYNVNPYAVYTIDSLAKDITADSLRMYMFDQTIELNTATVYTAPMVLPTINSKGGVPMIVYSILQIAAPYTTMTKAPTYLMYMGKPPTGPAPTGVLCQTTGIKTSNGATTLHVLANTHTFIRF